MTRTARPAAIDAINTLRRILRAGIRYSRSERMGLVRDHYLPQLRQLYEQQNPESAVICGRPVKQLGIKVSRVPEKLRCRFPLREVDDLPTGWKAEFSERIQWPPDDPGAPWPRHPFRFFLVIEREKQVLELPVHDVRDPWKGPTFKAQSRWRYPERASLGMATYLVYGDELSRRSLNQWLTVILAQRRLLTTEEEAFAAVRFFGAGDRGLSAIRRAAYEAARARFIQPIGGRPNFPSFLRATIKHLSRAQVFLDDGVRETERWESDTDLEPYPDTLVGKSDAVSAERHSRAARSAVEVEDEHIIVGADDLIPMKVIRRQEPKLHRALLDRIKRGMVAKIVLKDMVYVSSRAATAVEGERLLNSEQRQPKRFPDKRAQWIDRLDAKVRLRSSAARKLKRWMNTLQLSEAEIEASIAKGRVVRLAGRPRRR